jgi:hypothetical protein
MTLASRRKFITGLISLAATPAIVRVASIMRVNPKLIVRNMVVYVDAQIDNVTGIVGVASHGPARSPLIFATLQEAIDFIDITGRFRAARK